MSAPDDYDWCTVDLESKMNKKIDALQTIVQQQSVMIQHMSTSIQSLKEELRHSHQYSSERLSERLSERHDRTHELLEELKIMKLRETNMALREKIPIPFSPERGNGSLLKLSPYFLGRRMTSPSSDVSTPSTSSMSPTSLSSSRPTPFLL